MSSPVFILSTGRTGTQFFEDYINRTSAEAFCRHEPVPSRLFKFFSNMYLAGKMGPEPIAGIYRRSRKRILRNHKGKIYIESSNLIFGCIPALNAIYTDMGIIHIVRHPVDYVRSHLGHGFWKGHKRFFARYVPYWLEKIDLHNHSDPIEILSARWNYVNKQIQSYAGTNRYLLVRFEDLFKADPYKSSEKLNEIRFFCGLPPLEQQENSNWLKRPKNYSRKRVEFEPGEVELIENITGNLMQEYGYQGR